MYRLERKTVVFRKSGIVIPDVTELEKIGSGHDGIVYRYGNKVVKVLKYDLATRKDKGLMTFDKAVTLADEFEGKRFVKPDDILLDEDGSYCAYSMDFLDDVTLEKKKGTPKYKEVSSFTCGDLITAITELKLDVEELNRLRIFIKDINRGSYIYTSDFMHICDMDKFQRLAGSMHTTTDINRKALNFIIAKFIYFEILKKKNPNKEQLKTMSRWVKKCSNERLFLENIENEIGINYSSPIGEYIEEKAKSLKL